MVAEKFKAESCTIRSASLTFCQKFATPDKAALSEVSDFRWIWEETSKIPLLWWRMNDFFLGGKMSPQKTVPIKSKGAQMMQNI
eukprot:scaffold3296_cov159-Ochromonas_danica.AAC.13